MTAPDARTDFENRIYQRLDATDAPVVTELRAPTGLVAQPAHGHVRLSWDPVPEATGYVIERTGDGRPPTVLRHGGSDVPAVAGVAFADTGLVDGVTYRYRVGAVAGAEYPAHEWSPPVEAGTRAGTG
ncbi:MAG TPA: fibronectin type III domain-containing protein, partial [Micromonosporaceae bacterium]